MYLKVFFPALTMPKTVCFYLYSLKRYGNLKKKKSCSVKKKRDWLGFLIGWKSLGCTGPGGVRFPGGSGRWPGWAYGWPGWPRGWPGWAWERPVWAWERPVWVWDSPGRVWDPSRASLGSVPGGHYPPKSKLDRHWTDSGQTVEIHRPKLDFYRAC